MVAYVVSEYRVRHEVLAQHDRVLAERSIAAYGRRYVARAGDLAVVEGELAHQLVAPHYPRTSLAPSAWPVILLTQRLNTAMLAPVRRDQATWSNFHQVRA